MGTQTPFINSAGCLWVPRHEPYQDGVQRFPSDSHRGRRPFLLHGRRPRAPSRAMHQRACQPRSRPHWERPLVFCIPRGISGFCRHVVSAEEPPTKRNASSPVHPDEVEEGRVPWSGIGDSIGHHAFRRGQADQRATAGRLMMGSSLNWPTLSRWGGCQPSPTASQCAKVVVLGHAEERQASVRTVTIIGVDLAKNVFQLHGAAADGSVIFRKKLTRFQFRRFMAVQPACIVAMEACQARTIGLARWSDLAMKRG